MAQWIRICLPMQGTRVRSLIQEDGTCRGTAKPASHSSPHNYRSSRAREPQPTAPVPQLVSPSWAWSLSSARRDATARRDPSPARKSSPCSRQPEKSLATAKTQCDQKLKRKNMRGGGRRWEGSSGWGTHVHPRLIYVNVWQKPLQYCN